MSRHDEVWCGDIMVATLPNTPTRRVAPTVGFRAARAALSELRPRGTALVMSLECDSFIEYAVVRTSTNQVIGSACLEWAPEQGPTP